MRFLLAAVIAVLLVTSAQAERITKDYGGQIGPYVEKIARIYNTGQDVIIDGPCYSACTMVFGIIPEDRICVTKRAKLAFHAAFDKVNGQYVINDGGTILLMLYYSARIREWLSQKGGLNGKILYLQGRELNRMYRTCK